MVFVAGFTIAQNTVNLTQVGDNHKADVTQSGNVGNSAVILQNGGNGNRLGSPKTGDPGLNAWGETDDITKAKGLVQEGDRNKADITQTGDMNVIQQFRGLRSVFNSVYQKGNDNDIKLAQIGSNNVIGQYGTEYFGIDQRGNGNHADILQQGNANKLVNFFQLNDGNQADIDQVGNQNIINSATQQKLANVSPTKNILKVLQNGNSNSAALNELGDNINGDINQQGNGNDAQIQLTHSFAYGDVDQIGNSNKATITINQSYIGNSNRGVVYQSGNSNVATEAIGQRNSALSSHDNIMEVSQSGDLNNANILAEGNFHKAYLEQSGNSNKAKVEQAGGNSNVAKLKQSEGANADILQSGSENVLMGIDTDVWATSFNGSKLDLDQIGSGNILHLQQTNGASATVYQNGISNTSVVIQN